MAAGTIGKYERLDVLGHGTSGVVYLAWDTLLRRQVALKEIRADGPETERLLEEARVLDRLHHPHIVRIHSVDVVGGVILLDMELVHGRNLASVLKERAGEPLPEAEAVRIVTAVLDALGYAHERRIIHRDIKPANILFGNDGMVKLTDFGLAEALGTGSVAGGGGTYPYMAPEDFAEDAASDRRSDLWAAGVLLYELLTGKRPFTVQRIKDPFAWKRAVEHDVPAPPRVVNPALSPAWDAVLAKALAKNKTDRFGTAREFIAAIASVSGEPVLGTASKTAAMPVTAPSVSAPTVPEVPPGAFVFSSTGEIVYTLDELLRVAARNWDDARRALLDGRVEGFLRGVGEIYVADLAGECARRGRQGESPDKLLTEFLDRAQGEENDEAGTVMAPPRFAPVFRAPVMQREQARDVEATVAAPPMVPRATEPDLPEEKPIQAPSGVRWWYWPALFLSVAPMGAALFASAQPGFQSTSIDATQLLMVSAAISGMLAAMLLLIAVGTRMAWSARLIPLVPVGIGTIAVGGFFARAPALGVTVRPEEAVIFAIPVIVLFIQAATARAWWRFWVAAFFALSALSVGALVALH